MQTKFKIVTECEADTDDMAQALRQADPKQFKAFFVELNKMTDDEIAVAVSSMGKMLGSGADNCINRLHNAVTRITILNKHAGVYDEN